MDGIDCCSLVAKGETRNTTCQLHPTVSETPLATLSCTIIVHIGSRFSSVGRLSDAIGQRTKHQLPRVPILPNVTRPCRSCNLVDVDLVVV